jgi:hypothetical protein
MVRALASTLHRAAHALYPGVTRLTQPPSSSHGAVWPLVVEDAEDARLLDLIPSETWKAERRMLYHFFRSVWDGQGDVLEIGPFLGGTTRAIALGMMRHPRRDPAARLLTYDRFKVYRGGSDLVDYLAPLFANGTLNEDDRAAILATTDYEEVFHRVHRGHAYHALITCVNGALPDNEGEEERIENLFALPAGRLFSAVFIDGCKSWYGTRYFMAEAVARTKPGAWFIAQDYGQHTCFWLPAFFETFRDAFAPHAYVDATYAFQLTRPLERAEVLERFPVDPAVWRGQAIDRLFDALVRRACERDDARARVIYTIQWAAALAMNGDKARARELLEGTSRCAWAMGYEEVLAKARISPTYRNDLEGSHRILLDDREDAP